MISVLNMNIVGKVDSKSKMLFEFTIDNSTELPKSGLYQLGDKIYVIAEGSKAVDIVDKVVYKFINSKWVRTKDTYNPSTTSANTITTNGNHTIASNMLTGITDVNANVEPTGLIEKDITENGEYNASDDEATGYSKVSIKVPNRFYMSTRIQSLMVQTKISDTWLPKTWNGLTNFRGNQVWTDGDNIYYSSSSNQYVLNKSTSTWSPKTWNGITSFYGGNIWTDGYDIYCSGESTQSIQYVLDKSTSTWIVKEWNGKKPGGGSGVWTDGDNIYFSGQIQYGQHVQYVLDKSTSTWSTKTWNGEVPTFFQGVDIWTLNNNIYYGKSRVLNKSTSTWSTKNWGGSSDWTSGGNIWTDGNNIYFSNQNTQHVLNTSTSAWETKTWKGLTNFSGYSIWTDGNNIYYSYDEVQYYIPIVKEAIPEIIIKPE